MVSQLLNLAQNFKYKLLVQEEINYFLKLAEQKGLSKEKLNEILNNKNIDIEIIDYANSLDPKYYGLALGIIVSRSDVPKEQIINLINKEIQKKETAANKPIVESNKSKLDLLIEQYPEEKEYIKKLPNKYQVWLINRYLDKEIKETHSLKDSIVTLKHYADKESAILAAYKENKDNYRERLDIKVNPIEFNKLTVDDMDKLMSTFVSLRQTVEIKPTNIENDLVGKVGQWNIWLPSTRDNSIAIAQYTKNADGTLVPDTTWCTARIYESNLFYNYVGGSSGNLMLFYIIKDNANKSNPDDYLSLAFINGKPYFPSGEGDDTGDGSYTVDKDNKGITGIRLRSILGGNFKPIMDLMHSKSKSTGGKSPAFTKIEEASQDLNKYNNLIAGNSQKEKDAVSYGILKNVNYIDPNVKKEISKTDDINILKILSKDESINPSLLMDITKKLYGTKEINNIIINPKVTKEILDVIPLEEYGYIELSTLKERRELQKENIIKNIHNKVNELAKKLKFPIKNINVDRSLFANIAISPDSSEYSINSLYNIIIKNINKYRYLLVDLTENNSTPPKVLDGINQFATSKYKEDYYYFEPTNIYWVHLNIINNNNVSQKTLLDILNHYNSLSEKEKKEPSWINMIKKIQEKLVLTNKKSSKLSNIIKLADSYYKLTTTN